MQLKTGIIETKRLILRPFMIEDAPAVFETWASDPEATKYMSWQTHHSLADSQGYMAFVQEMYEKKNGGDWAVTLKATGKPIGSLGAYIENERVKSVNCGYIIGKPYWRQGYTSEAFRAVIDYLFRKTEVLRIEAYHDIRNIGSGAVMRKCGLTYEGTSRAAEANNTGICDVARYAILKDDYLKKEHTL